MHTVLLIEPDAALRERLRADLQSAGYMVLEVRDHRAALGYAKAVTIDAVVCASDVDGMPGFMLMRVLRDHQPGLRMVLMSSGAIAEMEHAHVTLKRPFTRTELVAELRRLIGG